MSKNRTLASLISNTTSKVKQTYIDSDAIVTSASLGVTAAAGTATYSSADTLPASATNGDQALVTSTNRLYIYTNGGWYNIALINSTPYWSSEASTSYDLSTTGAATVITILAVDSEGVPITYTATTDSDFDAIATVSKDSDNGRIFTVIPTDSENGTALAGSGTVTFKASDGVNLVSTLSTFSIVFASTNSNYTTILLKADSDGTDNQVDASSSSRAITENGNVTSTSFSPYHPGGYSYYFAGDGGDYFTIESPSQSGFSFGTDIDFCIEMWIYPFDASVSHILCDMRPDSTNGAYLGTLGMGSNNVDFYHNGVLAGTTSGTPVSSNQWNHIVFNRDGNNLNIFVNGTREYTTTTSYNFAVGKFRLFKNAFSAGGIADGSGGYIRDYRVVKGDSVYGSDSNLTLPTAPLTNIDGTSLLLFQKPYLADTVDSEIISYVGGETKRFGPYDYLSYAKADHGGSVYFDGSGDYMTVASTSDFGFGTSTDFTLEAWIYPTTTTGDRALFDFRTSSNDTATFFIDTSTGKLAIWNGSKTGSTGTVVSANEWHHVAFVRSGSTLTAYLDGSVDFTTSTSFDFSTAKPLGIGGAYYTAGSYFTGYFSDYRIVKGTAVYTAAFTPPTTPLTAITNTELLTCTNKNDIWDTGSGSLLTKYGNVTASTTQAKFATSDAVYFDGTGDYITAPGSLLSMGSEDYTAEGWFYFNSLPSSGASWHMLFSFRDGSNEGIALYVDGATPHLEPYTGSQQATGSTTLSTGQWYHIAFVRNSGTVYGYVNGNQDFTYSYSTTVGNVTTGYVGGNGAQDMNGYIQDLRVTKGLARYTTSFTPPTAEFDG